MKRDAMDPCVPADELARLAAAWQAATDTSARGALVAALGDAVSHTTDGVRARALLEADHCSDAIRCEVAQRTRDAERRRIAIAAIRDEDALAQLAARATDAALREAAAAQLAALARLRSFDGAPVARARSAPAPDAAAARVVPYVPRIVQQHLLADPDGRCWTAEGSGVLVDIAGFTALSEQLARRGREGAEQIAEIIGTSFEAILLVAYENGAGLLKFGGDALLLWFDGKGHAARACRAAFRMREMLPEVGSIEVPGATVSLQMSQGVHSGRFDFFMVGTSHREFLPVGPAWSEVAAMEQRATAGEILLSAGTAALLPEGCTGAAQGSGVLLARSPTGVRKAPPRALPAVPADVLARCLAPSMRAHVLGGGGTSEHRPVTIAFIRFDGTDALIERRGAEDAADALHRLMGAVAAAAEEQKITFLGSDVDRDGGKLILTAGAPTVVGDDEQSMLLALRSLVDRELPLPVRIGVHRGAVFAGDIGPAYRRTYTVMGDAVNLTARLMAAAPPGAIYATADVLERCATAFDTTELPPMALKGKSEPLRAWSIGRVQSAKGRPVALQRLPLTGRNAELGAIRKSYVSARSGAGRLIELVGEAGMGKTRLLEALRDAAAGFRKQHAACEAYTASTPYAFWRDLLRELMGFGRDDADIEVVARLRGEIAQRAPELAVWLPLIAIALGVDVAATAEVEMLAEKNRRTRLHEVVARFLQALLPEPTLIEIENAHHMDEASAELLAHLAGEVAARPWLLAVTRRPTAGGFVAPENASVVRIELAPLAAGDALRMAQLATQQSPLPAHVLEIVAKRSGGNPQFLRDLLRTAIQSGGVADLPDSAEAAAMAQIDALAPDDRAVVRRAAVFGINFHPRMLAWFAEEGDFPPADRAVWDRLRDLFHEEADGYLQFRRSLLRDAAYAGLPYKTRRRLHGVVAAHIEHEMDYPEEAAGTLSLHYFEAGEYRSAWRYAGLAARHAEDVYAYVQAAALYARALEAGRQLADLAPHELGAAHIAMADAWDRAGEFRKAHEAYAAAHPFVAGDALGEARVLLNLSRIEGKLGNYAEALRSAQASRDLVAGLPGADATRLLARASARYAMVLQVEGRTTDALEWAERAAAEAEAASDPEAVGDAYVVMGWAYGELGKEGALPLMRRSLEAYQQAGNRVREAMLLSDLGVVCQWEGHWDEALAYYEQGRTASLTIGSQGNAALARVNVAEILTDRGEWAEAEAVLLETLPFWRASQFRYFLAACVSLLGRVSLRLGRLDEALVRLEECKTTFLQVGAENELPPIDARIAECRLAMGNADGALEIVRGLLGRASESNGVARVVPLLERIQGHALLQQGDLWGARDALETSLAAAHERRNLFEAALTMLSLIELDHLEGIEPPLDMVKESRALLATLKVRAVPAVPRPAQ